MQFDLFHVYTVDQHTLAVLTNLASFASGQADERFSIAHRVWPSLRKPELLLLAGLFHDIGKGRGGDHSELGAVDAREFCEAHGLSEADTDLVEWLVRKHLLMSVTAQKQDISDPEVIHRFATEVADRQHLDYLYLLTCADIAGTSPKLWNALEGPAAGRPAYRHALRAAPRPGTSGAAERAHRREPRRGARAAGCAGLTTGDAIDAHVRADAATTTSCASRPDQIAWQTRGDAASASGDGPVVGVRYPHRCATAAWKCSCTRPTATACSRRW